MLIDLKVAKVGSLVLEVEDEELAHFLSSKAPFSVINVWKEEIYFNIPFSKEFAETVAYVHKGDVAYWEPGPALCVFFGYSQPYTPVAVVGHSISPIHHYYWVEDRAEVQVSAHKEVFKEDYEGIKEVLRKAGYTAAVADMEGGYPVVVACKYIEGRRISLELDVEEYGYYIETEPLYKYSRTAFHVVITENLTRRLSPFKYSRVDLNEDGYLCVSACCTREKELKSAIRELEEKYLKALDFIESLYSVPMIEL